jgi:hypothetical protein
MGRDCRGKARKGGKDREKGTFLHMNVANPWQVFYYT